MYYDFFMLRLTKQSFEIKYKPLAEVAELADALGSGLSGRKLVRVQVPPSALPTLQAALPTLQGKNSLKSGFFVFFSPSFQ
jgi:hypothetical protein